MEAEEPPRPPSRGGAMRMVLLEGQRLRVTGLSLADPAASAGQPHVRVWAEVGGEALVIGMLWSEHPVAAAAAPPLELGGEFVLCHDSAASSVRLYGYYLDPPGPGGGDDGQPARRRFLVDIDAEELGDEDDDAVAEEEYEEPLIVIDGDEEDLAGPYDGDRGEDERYHGDEDEEAGVEVEPLIEEELAEPYDGDGDDEEEVVVVVEEEEEEKEEEPSESREVEAAGETSKRRKISPGYSL